MVDIKIQYCTIAIDWWIFFNIMNNMCSHCKEFMCPPLLTITMVAPTLHHHHHHYHHPTYIASPLPSPALIGHATTKVAKQSNLTEFLNVQVCSLNLFFGKLELNEHLTSQAYLDLIWRSRVPNKINYVLKQVDTHTHTHT